MAKVSKTIGPLHFEDLEPHRFEDLVRQLIYDFRSWKAIEATGRVGLDEGQKSNKSIEEKFDKMSSDLIKKVT